MMFKYGTCLYNFNEVKNIEFYMKKGKVASYFTARITWKDYDDSGNLRWSEEYDQAAIDLAMRLGPQVLEGNPEFKFPKYSWMFHNLIAHPLMQILAFFGFRQLGLKIHDSTIPRPRTST